MRLPRFLLHEQTVSSPMLTHLGLTGTEQPAGDRVPFTVWLNEQQHGEMRYMGNCVECRKQAYDAKLDKRMEMRV